MKRAFSTLACLNASVDDTDALPAHYNEILDREEQNLLPCLSSELWKTEVSAAPAVARPRGQRKLRCLPLRKESEKLSIIHRKTNRGIAEPYLQCRGHFYAVRYRIFRYIRRFPVPRSSSVPSIPCRAICRRAARGASFQNCTIRRCGRGCTRASRQRTD